MNIFLFDNQFVVLSLTQIYGYLVLFCYLIKDFYIK